MEFITKCKELHTDKTINILDCISNTPLKNKNKILEYLKSGTYDGVRCSTIYDHVKNEWRISEGVALFTDGEFYWDSEEIYHFEKYNIELNKEFLKKFEE